MYVKQFKCAFLVFLLLTIITGVLYPLAVTAVAQILFNKQARGSIILKDGKPAGSLLIGQQFDDPKYFWGRLSATSRVPYNGASSSGSNFGPLNTSLRQRIESRINLLRNTDPNNKNLIPIDLVTSSASGLDPHTSLAAALYQVPRVARQRGLSDEAVSDIVMQYSKSRFFGVIGEKVVNVLQLNIALDAYKNEVQER